MKLKFLVTISFFFFLNSLQAVDFASFFTQKACRIDFQLAGNNTSATAYLSRIVEEPFWGGRQHQLDKYLNLGEYRFQITDSASGKLIYVDGFSTLFFEWQTTSEAKRMSKSFENSIQFPFPKSAVRVSIEKRTGFDSWQQLMQFDFSPLDKLIARNAPLKVPVKEILKSQSSDKAIDIAIVAEGYTAAQQKKFFADAQKLADDLFTHEPFKRHKQRINVYAIAAPSADTNVSEPHLGAWRNTAVGAHFYTFYEPRYLTTPHVFALRNYAALVPYDAIYILANTPTYGGGGIYNFYALASADSQRAKSHVVVHEFGHSFAGLGDEYFKEQPDVLDDMYDLKDEPWEPNITSLVNFDAKWKSDLPTGAIIPTRVTDETKKLPIGVFEGGGYLTKGMYRPAYDCRMRTNDAKGFCPVCEKAVERMILYLTGE